MAQEQEDRSSGELADDARKAVLKTIIKDAPNASGSHIRDLAETYAWLRSPGQPHGGTTTVSSS
jgi:hypothetical protein